MEKVRGKISRFYFHKLLELAIQVAMLIWMCIIPFVFFSCKPFLSQRWRDFWDLIRVLIHWIRIWWLWIIWRFQGAES